jgi:CheY-like chemotaxis protein
VNQRVASGILAKHGHLVVAVENGAEALQALKMQKFDLVLMDLQMPEMDGFAATAAIREQEQHTGAHLPIVAMTARAMKGDRECCLDAGMDGYLAKPVSPKELLATIESLVPCVAATSECEGNGPAGLHPSNGLHTAEAPSTTVEANTDPTAALTIDFAALMERVENDVSLLDDMIELYLDSSPRLLKEIEAGVERGDAGLIQRAAHALKGALQNLSAEPSAQAARKMEMVGRLEELENSEASLADLKSELERLQTALAGRPEVACS